MSESNAELTPKQWVIFIYAFGVIIASIYNCNWGDFSHKGVAYNFGRGLVWPITLAKSIF